MNTSIEELEAAALQLAPAERAQLAERLLSSLDGDDEILMEWVAEAELRADAYERGEMEALPFEEVLAKARAGLSRNTTT